MVAAAAREIHDGDKVFVGMRLPLLGFAVAGGVSAMGYAAAGQTGLLPVWETFLSIKKATRWHSVHTIPGFP
jgi:acyl CoA:acetate/3-ketoacid CoA transferase beta subunit